MKLLRVAAVVACRNLRRSMEPLPNELVSHKGAHHIGIGFMNFPCLAIPPCVCIESRLSVDANR